MCDLDIDIDITTSNLLSEFDENQRLNHVKLYD